MRDKFTEIANRIRIMTFGCKNKDIMSCEFGNEFAPRVEALLREEFVVKKQKEQE